MSKPGNKRTAYIPEIVAMGRAAFDAGCKTVEAAKAANPFRNDAFRTRSGHRQFISWNHGWNQRSTEVSK